MLIRKDIHFDKSNILSTEIHIKTIPNIAKNQ